MSNRLFALLKSSATVCLSTSEKAGRGLVARRQLDAHEALLSEAPIVCAPAPAHLGSVCSSCLQPVRGSNTGPSGSSRDAFCGAACQSSTLEERGPAGFPAVQQHCLATGDKFPLLAARLAAGFVYSGNAEPLQVSTRLTTRQCI